MRFFRSLVGDRSGATAVEYGLLVAILAVTLAISLGNYYELMNGMFGGLGSTYQNAVTQQSAVTQ